ncbi:beta-propeller fold lactonase family protein [Caulobacter segnis]
MRLRVLSGVAAIGLLVSPCVGYGQIAVSANDGKQVLEDGEQVVPAKPLPDTVSLIDLGASPPKLLGSVAAPTSVIGPPASVAVAPDESIALVTAARKLSPAGPGGQGADDQVSVIALKDGPPRVIATLQAGRGASGVSISPDGKLALVANRAEGTVSIFSISGQTVRPAGAVVIGDAKSAPAEPVFFDGGKRALVSRDGDHKISVLRIDGTTVTVEPKTLAPGLRPYQIDTVGPRRFAVVGNIGGGGKDVDTVSLIDLVSEAFPRVVDVVSVGLTPEGLKMSPDGRFVAVNVNNGSNASHTSPRYAKDGLVQVWRIDEPGKLVKVAEARTGGWGQGIVWSKDGKTLLVQCMVEQRLDVFGFDGKRLKAKGAITMPAGPAAIRTAEP